ncbi:MAG: hypothetical protein AAF725_25985, partial [Acidobacteriota bacterium]
LAARLGGKKILASPEEKRVLDAFDLETDPEEQSTRLDEEGRAPEESLRILRRASSEIARLKELHQGTRSEQGLDEDLRRELESLGYLGGLDSGSAPGQNATPVAFRAVPNPIQVCDGSGLGPTELVWRVPAEEGDVAIRLESGSGRLFAEGSSAGTAKTGPWVDQGMRFVLVSKAHSKVLAETRVSLTAAGCD